jgi:hypothetical protein
MQTYEDALDRGKLAILHEEPTRGVHVVAVGALAPGSEVEVITQIVTPLAAVGAAPSLRIPVTVGDLYDKSSCCHRTISSRKSANESLHAMIGSLCQDQFVLGRNS